MDTHTILLVLPELAVRIIQFFVALSILIVIHEFGHYLFARLTGTRVEKFYLFFDFMFPFQNIGNFSLFKKKIGETEYGMGWFPLGGYVNIAGMVDESTSADDLPAEPQPWEYRSKKSWQKLLIMLGGVLMNVLLAFLIYAFMFGKWGDTYLPAENLTYGIKADSVARSIGFQDGDMLLKIGEKKADRFGRVLYDAFMTEAKTFTLSRDGVEKTIDIPQGVIGSLLRSKNVGFISPRIPAVIDSVIPSSLNVGKLKAGDRVIALQGQPVVGATEVMQKIKAIAAQDSLANAELALTVLRGEKDSIPISCQLKDSRLDVYFNSNYGEFLEIKTDEFKGFSAFGKGVSHTRTMIKDYLIQLKLLFTSKEIKINESVGGFARIASMYPGTWDLEAFLRLTAFISLILAVMNLLPIPGLDGGFVMFLLLETITGRKFSDKTIERANGVGLILILALVLYVNGLDVWKIINGTL